jgi:hypothetical protein
LNEVVRDYHVHSIFSAPLRHMAIEAGRARSRERNLRHATGVRRLVAADAHRHVVLHSLVTARNVVRVVARQTGHLTVSKTCRLPQSVRAAGYLELVAVVAIACSSLSVIEVDERITQRPPRKIRKWRMLVTANLKWQRAAGRLEVALHAHFELPLAIQRRRVDDCGAAGADIPSAHRSNMPLSGAVTPLAINAFGQATRKLGSRPVVVNLAARVGVVARHAPFVDDPTKVEMIAPIVPGAHRPTTAAVGIPAHRQLQQAVVRRAVDVGPRMIARADHVISAELDLVRVRATESDLMTPLHDCAVALEDRVMTIRRGVIEASMGHVVGSNLRQRSRHAGQCVGCGNAAVAGGAR